MALPSRYLFGGVINWFPGHMAKATRLIESSLKKVDAVIEIRDARIPITSHNPTLTNLIRPKQSHVVVFTKADLANPQVNDKLKHYMKEHYGVKYSMLANLTESWGPRNRKELWGLVEQARANNQQASTSNKPDNNMIISMVVGLPNVGKSSLINQIIGKSNAGVAAKPGWTRGQQLYRVNIETKSKQKQTKQADPLLSPYLRELTKQTTWIVDNPGVMIPSRLETEQGLRLALCGCIDDTVIPDGVRTVGDYLFYVLTEVVLPDSKPWWRRLEMDNLPRTYEQTLAHIGKRWGHKQEQEQAQHFVSMFRKGLLGRYTLDPIEGAVQPAFLNPPASNASSVKL